MSPTINFEKYNSIENHYRTKFINQIISEGLGGGTWSVTEKIHGANFSFWTDGEEVKVAKRSSFTDSSFFNCGEVLEKYRQCVLDIHKQKREVRL